jgi:hypothetical protein
VSIDVELLLDWRTVAAALGVAAFLPGAALRQIVRIYPQGHPRRAELIADLYVRPFQERLLYVVQCLEISLAEGISERRALRRAVEPLDEEQTETASVGPAKRTFTIVNPSDFAWEHVEVRFPVGDLGMGVGAEFTALGRRNRIVGVARENLVFSLTIERLDLPEGDPQRVWTLPLPDVFGESPPRPSDSTEL